MRLQERAAAPTTASVCVLTLALSLLTMLPWQPTARACSPIPRQPVKLSSLEIPSDGLVAGTLDDCGACTASDVRVFELDTQAVVAGELLKLSDALTAERWFAFRPSSPLVVGRRYAVRTGAKEVGQDDSLFQVVATETAQLSAEAAFFVETRGADTARCEVYDPSALGGLCSAPVFYRASVRSPALTVSVSGAQATQLAYRIVWSADGARQQEEAWLPGTSFKQTFESARTSVCYELFSTSLTTGSEQRLAGSCHEVDPSQVGPSEKPYGNFSAGIEETLRTCLTPPGDLHDQWCQTFATAIESGTCENTWAVAACLRALIECGKPASDDAGSAMANPTQDGEQPFEAANVARKDARADGCNLAGNGKPSSVWTTLIVALCLAARRRRVTRQIG